MKTILIHLYFAMTIYKAHGQTIHNVRIYLRVFFHGQLYIALSSRISVTTKVWIKPIGDNNLPSNCTKKYCL